MKESDTSRLIGTEDEKENSINGKGGDQIQPMTTYYRTRREAEAVRRKGDRIYYEPGMGYYIRRPKKRDPWSLF